MLLLPIPIRTYSRRNGHQRPPGGCLGAVVFVASTVLIAFLLAAFCDWSVKVDYAGYTGTFAEFLTDTIRSFIGKLR